MRTSVPVSRVRDEPNGRSVAVRPVDSLCGRRHKALAANPMAAARTNFPLVYASVQTPVIAAPSFRDWRREPQEYNIQDNKGQEPAMNTRKDMTESDSNGHGARSARPAAMAAPADSSPAAGELQNFLADIEDLVTSMTSLTGEDLARAKAKLSERVAVARESIAEMGDEIGHRARKAAHDTDQYVHENPWQAIGIGAALGLLIGVLVARHK